MSEGEESEGGSGSSMSGLLNALGVMKKIKPAQLKGFTKAFGAMKEIGSGIGDNLKDIGVSFGKISDALGITQAIMKPFMALLDMLGKTVQAQLAPIMQKLFEALFQPEIINLMGVMADLIVAVVVPAVEFLVDVIQMLVDMGVIDALTTAIKWLADTI